MEFNSLLNHYSEKYQNVVLANSKNDLEENFQILIFDETVNVRFRFCPYLTKSPDSNKLPVISHFEFRLDGVLAEFYGSKYHSFFFMPLVLNEYSDIQEASKYALMSAFKEHNITQKEFEKYKNKENQLTLF